MKTLNTTLLLIVSLFFSVAAFAQCNVGCTFTINNGNKNSAFNLTGGQKLCIPSGQTFGGTLSGTGTVEVCGTYSGSNTLAAGIAMTVNTGGRITLNSTLTVNGSLINNSTVSNAVDVRGLAGSGSVNNAGNMSIGNNGLAKSSGSLTNSGAITMTRAWVTSGTAVVTNSGTVTLTGSSQAHSHTGGNFTNSGTITISGNNSDWTWGGSGTIENSGTFDSQGTNNIVTLNNSINNYGTFKVGNTLAISPGATLLNDFGASVTAGNSINNLGTITNNGSLVATPNLTNGGTITNSGTFTVTNNLTNTGSLGNGGVFNIGGNLSSSGTITITQNMTVDGSLTTTAGSITFSPNRVITANSYANSGATLSCPSCTGGSLNCAGVGTVTASHPGIALDPVYTCQIDQPGCGCNAVSNSGLVILPVSLIYIKQRSSNGVLLVDWATASEHNNAYFDVEISVDGAGFEAVGRVEGQGNSQNRVNYSYMLPASASAARLVLVRLKQVDFDGKFEYSPVLKINNGAVKTTQLAQLANPSPASQPLTINWLTAEEAMTFALTDAVGRLTAAGAGTAQEIEKEINQLMLTNGPGIYLLQLQAGQQQESHRLVRR